MEDGAFPTPVSLQFSVSLFLITGLSFDYYDGRKEPVSCLIPFFCLLDALSACLRRLSFFTGFLCLFLLFSPFYKIINT